MRLVVIASPGCGHCNKYAQEASEYVPVKLFPLSHIKKLGRKISGVPYSLLYDDQTIIAEWQGADIAPLFSYMKDEKMKVRFKINCRDKYTNEEYRKGRTKEFPRPRAQELIQAGAATEVKPKHDNDNSK